LPTLATKPRVGPRTPANPKPTGVGKRGVQGAKPPGGGSWGVSPHKFKFFAFFASNLLAGGWDEAMPRPYLASPPPVARNDIFLSLRSVL